MVADTRKQVLEQIIDEMMAAHERGHPDPMKAAGDMFPGVPAMVLAEAWCELGSRLTEKWWQQVERTIDGEIVRRALLSNGEGGQ